MRACRCPSNCDGQSNINVFGPKFDVAGRPGDSGQSLYLAHVRAWAELSQLRGHEGRLVRWIDTTFHLQKPNASFKLVFDLLRSYLPSLSGSNTFALPASKFILT